MSGATSASPALPAKERAALAATGLTAVVGLDSQSDARPLASEYSA
jgi:hypothetical protein